MPHLLVEFQIICQLDKFSVHASSQEASLKQICEQIFVLTLLSLNHRGEDLEFRFVRQSEDTVENMIASLSRDRPTALIAAGLTDSSKQDSQVIIDFCDRADSRPRVPATRLLLNRNGRGQACDGIDFGLGHLTQELPRVRRQ